MALGTDLAVALAVLVVVIILLLVVLEFGERHTRSEKWAA
jgi:hypothetical protein